MFILLRALFVLHFSISFTVGEIMWGFFKIIFYTVGVMLKITEVPEFYTHKR